MKSSLRFVATFALLALAIQAKASVNTDSNGLALEGHDPVAFFSVGVPTLGKSNLTADHEGATYRFVSKENRERFLADPTRFTPAFGGYCAFGAAKGKLFPVEIDTWQIKDDRLILNYNDEIKAQFNANIESFLAKADVNWSGLKTAAKD
ncbi:MAG: YHS domain-containing (seleno)protein [Synoicihabitans sp.]